MSKRCVLLAKIHIAKKDLGLDEDSYRAALVLVTGKDSSGTMTKTERQQVIDHFKTKGWNPKKANTPRKPGYSKKTSRLMIMLWKDLYKAGKVANQTRSAFEAWVKGQTEKANPDWLTDAEASTAIEQLKRWIKR